MNEKENCRTAGTCLTDENGKRRCIKRQAKSNSEAETKLKIILREIGTEGKKIIAYNKMAFAVLTDLYL